MSSEPEISNKQIYLEADDRQVAQGLSRDAVDFIVGFVTEGEEPNQMLMKDNQRLMKEVQESLDAWYNS